MSGIVALSVNYDLYGNAAVGKAELDKKFVDDLFWLTFYHQHLSQEYSGLATISAKNNQEILVRTHRGLFRQQFEHDLEGFKGPLGIGHVSAVFREPLKEESAFPDIYIAFAGNLINRQEILDEFLNKKHGFARTDDISLIARLIIQTGWNDNQSMNENFIKGITYMTEKIEGSYALAIFIREKIYVVRGPDGHELLSVGAKKGAVATCSESTGFYNQGFEQVRDIKAGEIVVLNNGEMDSLGIVETKKKIVDQPCSFRWVYTSFPSAVHFDISAAEVRRRLGAKLAARDIKDGFIPDVVVPVPDSGRFHAIGYIHEFARQINSGKINKMPSYDEVLLKYPYASRSYTPASEEDRNKEAVKKIIPNTTDKYKGKVIVVVDDSIVRGTQSRNNLIPKIRATGVKEIHFRIANPKLVSTCEWGKSNKKKRELGAFNSEKGEIRTDEEMAEMLGISSCRFNQCTDLASAIGIPLDNLCVACSQLSSKEE